MATYFVASGGSNTSPYDTWAKAATSLQTALTAASSDNDVVVIQYNAVPATDSALSADTTYTVAADVIIISASNDGGSSYTPTAMGTANYIGHGSLNRSITIAGTDKSSHWYGVTFLVSGSTSDNIDLANTGHAAIYEDCYFWIANTSSLSSIRCTTTSNGAAMIARQCTFRFGAVGQQMSVIGSARIIGGSVSSAGSSPTTLFDQTSPASWVEMIGFDLSHCTGELFGNISGPCRFILDRCKLGSGLVILPSQTDNPTLASPEVFVMDCHTGDTHGLFGYYNALGQVTSDTGIYFTSGAAGQSWKIVTTSLANRSAPFITPFIDLYHTGASAITPYLEILRNGSTTPYTDAQVWGEFSAKVTTGFVTATKYDDRAALASYAAGSGTNQAAGAGTGSWTGGTTPWSGKVDSGSSLTPAEAGYIRARVFVADPSITVYVDPQIRT